MSDWFTAHKDGLRQIHERLIERRALGFGLIGGELYQNVMDTDATECVFTIEKVPGKPRVVVTCVDNGHGFHNLTDAWTMYAPSEKKGDPTKAGRFNLGEKAVLSFAHEASIHTTSGTVIFSDKGRENFPRRKRDQGTEFRAELACNEQRYQQLLDYMRLIIVRPGLTLIVNGEEIPHRQYLRQFEHQLPTEIGDDLRPTRRIASVEVYDPGAETPMLYELGIPVVETEDKWHVNIGQKVPLNVDRDNVTPSYLRQVRVAVFNQMHTMITEDDTTSTWVTEASSDKDCTPEAVETLRVKKYGEKSVASDPNNPEADGEAMSKGFTVIPSRGLTSGQRANLKAAGTLLTSSKAFPHAGQNPDSPIADDIRTISDDQWTDGMKLVAEYTAGLAERLLKRRVFVEFVHSVQWSAAAGYSPGRLCFNVFRLGKAWFEGGAVEKVDRLIIHELGHEFAANHLSEQYHDGLSTLGARIKRAALDDPEWFRKFEC